MGEGEAPADDELQALLLREARERVRAMRRALGEGAPSDTYGLFRHAHTLTGIAGNLGTEEVEALARNIVHHVRDAYGRPVAITPESEEALRRDVARLETLLGEFHGPERDRDLTRT